MNFDDSEFKLADCFLPSLTEGKYTVKGVQTVTSPQPDTITVEKSFYVAANAQTLTSGEVFSVSPACNQQGDFSGKLPFIVFNSPSYPWAKNWTDDIDGHAVPWLALIVVAEDETVSEQDVKYSELAGLSEDGVYFPYDKNEVSSCRDDDNIHICTVSKSTFNAIKPSNEDLPWLAHAKFVDLSASDDVISQQDGWFSTVIANRFVPSSRTEPVKSTIHLINISKYGNIPESCGSVRFISIYHWSVYSEKTEDKSFVSLTDGLSRNSSAVKGYSLKPHYLRTGEKTYSVYHSPILPMGESRYENINGEDTYTADGRLIYDRDKGIFDISYSAAFNLGRTITLNHRAQAKQIVSIRKNQAIKKHIDCLKHEIGFDEEVLTELCKKISGGKLL